MFFIPLGAAEGAEFGFPFSQVWKALMKHPIGWDSLSILRAGLVKNSVLWHVLNEPSASPPARNRKGRVLVPNCGDRVDLWVVNLMILQGFLQLGPPFLTLRLGALNFQKLSTPV